MSLYLGNNLISGSGTSIEPSRNMGQIISSTLPLVDAGLHLLDGALISGSGSYSAFVDYIADIYDGGNYPDLFDTEANWQSTVTQYGVCGKFVYTPQKYAFIYPGDNSTGWYCNSLEVGANFYTASGSRLSTIASISGNHITIADSSLFPLGFDRDTANDVELSVRLPKITGIVEGTTNVSALGDLVEAGLPNIAGTGGTGFDVTQGTAVGGTFYTQAIAGKIANNSSGSYLAYRTDMDASLYNSIYGNSSTVQPQTIKVLYYIVIATSTKTQIQVDIDEIATDLNGKADRDGSNMVNSVKNFDGGWVDSRLIIANNVSTPTTSNTIYDLSSYLPNDGYDYEVLLSLQVTSGTTSGNVATLYFQTDVINAGHIYGARAVTRTNSSNTVFSFGTAPVGTGRTITVIANSGNTGTYYLILNAYRRLGTNQ